MKKLLISLLILGTTIALSGSAFACDIQCSCGDNCKCKQECSKDCTCGCQKDETCNCDSPKCNCEKQNCNCGKKHFFRFFKKSKCNCQ